MPQLVIDKIFAENLGAAFGGCLRDQLFSAFSRDIAKAAGVKLSPLPFFGAAEKTAFKAKWAALLHGVGLWSAMEAIPEIKADEKLARKMSFSMQAFADEAVKPRILDGADGETLARYSEMRRRFLRLAKRPDADKDAFSRAFLSVLWEKPEESFTIEQVMALSAMIGLAHALFTKLAVLAKNEPIAYKRRKSERAANNKR